MTVLQQLRRPFPHRNYNAVFWIIGINILVFIVTYMSRAAEIELSLIPGLTLYEGRFWQPLSYMFVHADVTHLLFNSLGLYFFGSVMEKTLGSIEFIILYLVTGFLAGLASLAMYAITGQYLVQLVGASGAVFAVLFLFAVYYPDSRIMVFYLFPVRAKWLVLYFTIISILFGIGGRSSTAHLTHLFGFAFSYVYAIVRLNVPAIKRLMR